MSNRAGEVAPQLFTPDDSDMMYRSNGIGEWTDDILTTSTTTAAMQPQPQPQASTQPNRRSMPTPPTASSGVITTNPNTYPRPPTRPSNPSSLATTNGTSSSSDRGASTPPPLSQIAVRNGTLNERFEFMLECTQAVGSDNFDSLAIAYYTGKFGPCTPLSNEQRLSRNRGVPKLIREVHSAAREWSDWERRGFYDEVLKTTELVLVGEVARASESLREVMGSSEGWDRPGGPEEGDVVRMKRVIEDEVSTTQKTDYLWR